MEGCLCPHGGLRASSGNSASASRLISTHPHIPAGPLYPLSQLFHPIISFLWLTSLPKLEIFELMLYFPSAPFGEFNSANIYCAEHCFPLIEISHGTNLKFWLLSFFSSPMADTPTHPPGTRGMTNKSFALHFFPYYIVRGRIPFRCSPFPARHPSAKSITEAQAGSPGSSIHRDQDPRRWSLWRRAVNRGGGGDGENNQLTC